MEDQPQIIEKFAMSFEACDELQDFARTHRPDHVPHEAALIVSGTIARSDATFKCVVELCRMGYGDQASMLNRTLFEDMISVHWATRFPKRAVRLLGRHDDWARVRFAQVLERHDIGRKGHAPLPEWSGKRKKRLRKLFGRGSWTGRSIPKMLEQTKDLWPPADAARMQRMHDVLHQGHNILMHYSARSLQMRVRQNPDGSYAFDTAPSERFVGTALGFAFWTYANTISLGVKGDDAAELNALAAKYDSVVPDPKVRAQ